MGIIYSAYNKIENKYYVGQTIGDLDKRKYSHYNGYSKTEFTNKLKSTPKEDWVWRVEFENVQTEKELNKLEGNLIIKYNSVINGYNSQYRWCDYIKKPKSITLYSSHGIVSNGMIEEVMRTSHLKRKQIIQLLEGRVLAIREWILYKNRCNTIFINGIHHPCTTKNLILCKKYGEKDILGTWSDISAELGVTKPLLLYYVHSYNPKYTGVLKGWTFTRTVKQK